MPDDAKAKGKKPPKDEKAEPKICIEKEFRELPVKLTRAELEDFGKQIGKAVEEKESAEGRKAIAMKNFRAEIGGLDDKVKHLAESMSAEAEKRLIECEWTYDLAHNEKTLKRKDTRAVVEKKTLRADEVAELRNPRLPLKGGKGKPAPAAPEATVEKVCTNIAGCGKVYFTKPDESTLNGLCHACAKERIKEGKGGKKDDKGLAGSQEAAPQ